MPVVRHASIEAYYELPDEFTAGRPELLELIAADLRANVDPMKSFRRLVGDETRMLNDPTVDNKKIIRGIFIKVNNDGSRVILE